MKYALIGCGRISKNHIKASICNGLYITAVCDVEKEVMNNFVKVNDLIDKDIDAYTDYRELVERERPELVSIATESGCHAEIASYCIEHHINVIIEKPIAMSMYDADKLVQLAGKYNVKVCAYHQNRFNPAVQAVREAIEKGRFGKLSHGSVNIRWNRDASYYAQAKWHRTWKNDGAALMNQCIYGIDLLRWMLGDEIQEVYGQTRQRFHNYLEAEDFGMAVIKFKNGVIASIEGTTNVYPKNLEETLYIFGENGSVKIGGTSANNIGIWEFKEDDEKEKDLRNLKEVTGNVYGNGHIALFADMIQAININRKPYVDILAGRNAVEVVLAIYKSQKEGKPKGCHLGIFQYLIWKMYI